MAKKAIKSAVKPAAKAAPKLAGVSKNLAIVALIVNIFIPGLGTLIAGKTKIGIIQLAIAIISIPLMAVAIGYLTGLANWIWAIVTGVKLVQSSS